MRALVSTLGQIDRGEAGIILPHEHVFVDLRTPDDPAHGQADGQEVVAVMAPELERARSAGIGLIVEASTLGVGRRVDILAMVSRATGFPLLAPTGVYREPWIPRWVHEASEEALERWMVGELTEGIEESGVQAGWIKLSAGDDGLTDCESKVLRAAARAARRCGATIGSHTIRGRVVAEQLRVLEEEGLPPERFVWIHTQAEADARLHLELGRRGIWLEFDAIGGSDDEKHLDLIRRCLDAGLESQLLLSQDRGWYDPSKPKGGEQKPYAYLVEGFLPKLIEGGVAADLVDRLTRENPFRAFARELPEKKP